MSWAKECVASTRVTAMNRNVSRMSSQPESKVKYDRAGIPTSKKILVVVQFEFFSIFKPFTERHLEGRKRVPRFRVPIRARFWREWADQRASSPERPCVYLPKQKVPRPIRALTTARPH